MFEPIMKSRKRQTMKYVGYSLMAMICIAFVFAGFFPDFSFMGTGSAGGAAATVNGQVITLSEFRESLENYQQENKNRGQNNKQFEGEILDLLIDRELFVQKMKEEGFWVAEKQIFDEIVKVPIFQDKGQFSRLNYKNYLNAVRSNEAEFEDKISRSILLNHLSNFFTMSSQSSQLEEKIDKELENIYLNASYLKLNENALVDPLTIGEADTKDYLQKNESKIKSFYEQNKASKYTTPEQVSARHILIKGTGDDALTKIKNIKAQISDKNFSDLAKKFSEDPGSKDKGGDLGFFSRGKMVKEFEDYSFNSAPGVVSEPIKSSFGYHLIQVQEKKSEKITSYDEVKFEIAKSELIKEKSTVVKDDLKLKVEAGKLSDVEDMAKKHKWSWLTTGNFSFNTESVPGVGALPDFVAKVTDLSPENPMAKSWIRRGDEIFIVKYMPNDGTKPKDPMAGLSFFKQFMEKQKSFQAWNSFRSSIREGAKIKKGEVFTR